MCDFDSYPIWQYYTDDQGEYVLKLEGTDECPGKYHDWYYNVLILCHIYYLIDFIFRTLIQKYRIKFLFSFEGFIEIFTTIPFFICIAAGTGSYGF
jgi:hypothetical protein